MFFPELNAPNCWFNSGMNGLMSTHRAEPLEYNTSNPPLWLVSVRVVEELMSQTIALFFIFVSRIISAAALPPLVHLRGLNGLGPAGSAAIHTTDKSVVASLRIIASSIPSAVSGLLCGRRLYVVRTSPVYG